MTTLDPRARSIPLDAAIAEAEKSGFLSIEDLQRISQPQAGEPVEEPDLAETPWGEIVRVASPQPANPAQARSTISENTTKETDMPKLTSKIALELVTRIEALNDQIYEVYREANDYDGINNSNVIRDIVKAREEANDQKCISDGLLEALDLDEDEE